MRIAVRADASTVIGSGHVMRCLALAAELQSQGAEVTFICRDEPGNLIDQIAKSGFVVHRLPASGSLPQAWHEDAEATQGIVSGMSVDWLIVDHYRLDARWENFLRGTVRRIVAIDDVADRSHDCDVLLDQNVFADMDERYRALVPADCISLLGPRYALLRAEFREARMHLKARDGTVKRIFIFFGGSDPANETAKALAALKALSRPDIAADVVVGAANPNRDQIEEMCRFSTSVSYHCQARNMAELMLGADLAIGAGGSATWERCCVGLPSIVIAIADNQVQGAQSLAGAGAIRYLGRSEGVTVETLAKSLADMLADPAGVSKMSKKALDTVDACGTQRVVAAMCQIDLAGDVSAPLVLRRSTLDDAARHFEWRNALEVRAWSFNDQLITWDEHIAWYRAALQNPNRHLLVGEESGQPVGVLRYDVSGDEAEVSIFLVPGIGGKGIGTRLLKAGSAWVKSELPQVARIRARILPSNIASLRAFEKAGYMACGEDYFFTTAQVQ